MVYALSRSPLSIFRALPATTTSLEESLCNLAISISSWNSEVIEIAALRSIGVDLNIYLGCTSARIGGTRPHHLRQVWASLLYHDEEGSQRISPVASVEASRGAKLKKGTAAVPGMGSPYRLSVA